MRVDVNVFGLSIKTFGIFFALNFIAWGALAHRRLGEIGRPREWASEMGFVAIAGGLLGAKLYYAVEHASSLSLSGVFSGSGLVWYGGLAGGVVAMLLWARWRNFLTLELFDMAGPCLALGYAVGRIGCQVSGDGDYGKASDLPWAMPYPDGAVPTTQDVQPTPIYETVSMGILAVILWRLRDRFRPGVLFALYLVGAGVERFLVEFVRRNDEVAAGLTAAQLWALALLAIGAGWLVVTARRSGGVRGLALG
jgi:phosphatidylglycerol:prolipoprotein diacylglycerol transferase